MLFLIYYLWLWKYLLKPYENLRKGIFINLKLILCMRSKMEINYFFLYLIWYSPPKYPFKKNFRLKYKKILLILPNLKIHLLIICEFIWQIVLNQKCSHFFPTPVHTFWNANWSSNCLSQYPLRINLYTAIYIEKLWKTMLQLFIHKNTLQKYSNFQCENWIIMSSSNTSC